MVALYSTRVAPTRRNGAVALVDWSRRSADGVSPAKITLAILANSGNNTVTRTRRPRRPQGGNQCQGVPTGPPRRPSPSPPPWPGTARRAASRSWPTSTANDRSWPRTGCGSPENWPLKRLAVPIRHGSGRRREARPRQDPAAAEPGDDRCDVRGPVGGRAPPANRYLCVTQTCCDRRLCSGVVVRDARLLSPQAQEDLRRRAVAAVKAGHTQAAVSTVLGVSPQAVSRWVNAIDRKGNRALQTRLRGRRPR